MIKYKILIVDDVIENLKTVFSIIEKHHPEYIIYQANNGKKALELIENVTPDLILTDWEMPEMSGIELLQILQQQETTKHIPVIIVTGIMITADDLKMAMNNGASDYVRKPIVEIELLARMHSAIRIAENYKYLINEKEKKIVDNVLLTNEINNFLSNIAQCFKDFKNNVESNQDIVENISEIIAKIEQKIQYKNWQRYTKAYSKLNPELARRLLKRHPSLTPVEIELAGMIRLGLRSKELAELMFVKPESMRVSRSRLRKRLGLNANQNLETYLLSI